MKKVAGWCAFFAIFACLFPVISASAAEVSVEVEAEAVAEQIREMQAAIPPEVAELLPEGFFSESVTEMGESVAEASTPHAILAVVGKLTGMAIGENLSLLARICGVLVLCAVFRSLSGAKGGVDGVGGALSLCATLSLVLVIFSMQRSRFFEISAYFEVMEGLATAMLPLMGALYAMGGNISAAVANHGVMSAFLSLLETVVSGTVMPVAGICLALGILEAVAGKLDLRPLNALIKRTYTLGISFLMLMLCGVLGIQATLAKGSDTLALRAVRFAAGSFLPVVGGSVSEALRTVAGSVQYLRGVVGVGGILVILLAFLPVFLSVALDRITFLLCGAAAKLLGCDSEERILAQVAAVYGYFLAVIASLFVMMIFSLTLFARCAAMGGA